MSLVGFVSLVGVLVEGRWSQIFRPLIFLGIAAYNAFVLLPPMWRELTKRTSSDQASSSLQSAKETGVISLFFEAFTTASQWGRIMKMQLSSTDRTPE
jgi:hypothetical protein